MTTLDHPTTTLGTTSTTADPTRSRAWAVSGAAAAVATAVAMGAQGALSAAYDSGISGNAAKVAAEMAEGKLAATVFHVGGACAALLLVPFAVGLHRRLRDRLGSDSLLPGVAALGVALTSMVMVMATALDTEFGIFVPPAGEVPAEHVSFYGHWIGTVPCLWLGIGVTGLAVFAASRRGAVSRSLGIVGLVLGLLTAGTGVSPLEYLALLPGVLWLLVTSVSFLVGDRAYRRDQS